MASPSNTALVGPAATAAGFFASLVVAVGLLATWEPGPRQRLGVVFLDGGGVPTVCYGHTGKDVSMGQPTRSDRECMFLLERDAFEHGLGLQRCLTGSVPASLLGSFISWTTNVGVGAACKSTAVRKANAGDFAGACAELSRWVNDNGRPVWGLKLRREGDATRQGEREVCESGL